MEDLLPSSVVVSLQGSKQWVGSKVMTLPLTKDNHFKIQHANHENVMYSLYDFFKNEHASTNAVILCKIRLLNQTHVYPDDTS